jgi:hypothetical protein
MTDGLRMLAYDPSDVKPGWIAFFVVMALLVATFLLWRNMNKQLGKIKVPYSAELRERDVGTGSPPSPSSVVPPQDSDLRPGDDPT